MKMVDTLVFDLPNGNKLTIMNDPGYKIKPDLKQNIIGRLIKTIMRKVHLKPVGRKLFNIKKSEQVKDFEIWPGFSTSFISTMGGSLPMLNVDLVHKVITNQNVLK